MMHQPLEDEALSPFEDKLMNYSSGRDIRVLLKNLRLQKENSTGIRMATVNNYIDKLLSSITDEVFRTEVRREIEELLKGIQENEETKS